MSSRFNSSLSGKNKALLFAWLFAVGGAVAIGISIQNRSAQFFGTTGSDEQLISFQYPVEIVQAAVVEGQVVEQGDQLLEVRRSDLMSRIAIIEDQILEVNLKEVRALAEIAADVENIKAQQASNLAELDAQINSLESQYALNMKIMNGISGSSFNVSPDQNSESSDQTDEVNPLLTQIKGLKETRFQVYSSYLTQIKNLEKQLGTEARPASAQIAELEKRHAELSRQQADLIVRAELSGNIGSVIHKQGEQVAPFSLILSLHSNTPSFVKGYIHEAVINDVKPGQKVWIESLSSSRNTHLTEGVVESIGNRIVEFPPRLRTNPIVTSWGREVVVFLNEDTSLLQGEKVLVLLDEPKTLTALAQDLIHKLNPESYANEG